MNKQELVKTILENHPNKSLGFYEYKITEDGAYALVWSTKTVAGEFHSTDIIAALAVFGLRGTLSYSASNSRVELTIYLS